MSILRENFTKTKNWRLWKILISPKGEGIMIGFGIGHQKCMRNKESLNHFGASIIQKNSLWLNWYCLFQTFLSQSATKTEGFFAI